ncbi:MAG: ABC transporter ATP-binding protein [Planctomycetes bacterium]|nr:ABC transporter ATP-binding protein [Planctomycetota bacterium]
MTDGGDSQRDSGALEALVRRLWSAVVANRRLVGAMVAFAVLETLFTKAPLVLVKPLMSELAGNDAPLIPPPWLSPLGSAPAVDIGERFSDHFNLWFRDFSQSLVGWLGLGFANPRMNVILACGVVAIVCGALGAVTIYFVQTISRFFAVRVVSDLRCELAEHFLRLPLGFYGRQRMGEMISKVTNDTQVMQRSFELAADHIVVDPLMIVGNLVILAWFVPQAIWVLLVMVPLMAIPMYRQGKKVQRRSTKSLAAMGEATESLNQILTGIRTVKAFQLEDQRYADYQRSTATFLDRTRRMLRTKGRSIAQTFFGYQVGFAILLALLGYVVLVDHSIDFSDVGVALVPLSTTYQHVKRMTRSYHVLMESAGALYGIETILQTEQDPTRRGGKPVETVRGHVAIEDVWFGYGGEQVLRGVSLEVAAGQTVALVGPSGAGKSTLMDLLMRFHDPSRGRIRVDGMDLREVRLADFRAHTAVVSQQPFLFNTSIRDNIGYGRPGATQAEIEQAARAANIHDFILTLPDGYDTPAGERGSNLSGGQMQRITIARAILRNPAILFLDEATSALDSENEELVQRALDRLRAGRTSFVIAHRLSTIADADVIVVLDQGQIVEIGSHRELIEKDGAYKRMRDLQTA